MWTRATEATLAWHTLIGWLTLVGLFLPAGADLTMVVRTVLLVHIIDAVMCRLFASNNGYPRGLWTLLGFVFGIWAVAVLIVLPKRRA